MDATLPEYELFAIRYAERDARRADHFIGGDPHDGPMPMDYFVWAAIGRERSFVIDTGFTAEVAAARGRRHLRCPAESLSLVGLDRNAVEDVILTHMHYDHVGTFHRFPAAQFHLQETELHYTTGHYMRHPFLARSFEVEDVVGIVRLNFARRVKLYNGPVELAPGITIHPVGGHTPGMQFVRVHTSRGWVVLASDVSHYYENMEAGRPFTAAFHIGDMIDAYDTLRAHAPSPQHIIPGPRSAGHASLPAAKARARRPGRPPRRDAEILMPTSSCPRKRASRGPQHRADARAPPPLRRRNTKPGTICWIDALAPRVSTSCAAASRPARCFCCFLQRIFSKKFIPRGACRPVPERCAPRNDIMRLWQLHDDPGYHPGSGPSSFVPSRATSRHRGQDPRSRLRHR